MTIDEPKDDLASSWQKFVNIFYYEELRSSFENTLKKSDSEGLTDLNCIIIKIPITIDFSNLINFNPDFYDHFNSAGPEELKGLIRESVIGPLQELMSNLNEELKLDKRQVSVEIFMKNLPCSDDVLLSSKDFYLSSIPTLISEHLDLKGSWSSHAKILIGKIISISESFQVSDIQSFACTNKRCRNNQKVIRHVGLNHLEQVEELGPSGTTPEVFISSTGRSKAKISIKCHNCREEIEELYPFRSNLEFKIAKVNVDGGSSCFPIDILLAGSMACKAVKLSNEYSFIGYPRLAAELSHQLKHAKGLLGPFYFEVYGADPLICYETTNDFIKPALNWLISRTNEKLRFCLLLLICQVIGATNGIHFDLCLPGIDDRVINKIYKLFNVLFNYNNNNNNKIMGIVHLTSSKLSKQKTLHVSEQIYPFHVNIVNEKLLKNIPIAGSSFLYTNGIPNDQLVIIPIDLSLNEEADILLKTTIEQDLPKIQLPAQNSQLHLSEVCLQSYFLRLRSKTNNLPMKFSLSLLTKLSQISALNHNKLEADEGDADFAIMIHAKLVESAFEFESSFDYQSQEIDCIDYIMSPSITFDDSIDLSCEKNHPKRLKDYYGII